MYTFESFDKIVLTIIILTIKILMVTSKVFGVCIIANSANNRTPSCPKQLGTKQEAKQFILAYIFKSKYVTYI